MARTNPPTGTHTLAHGTWLAPEPYAYPNGGQTRRGRAILSDGTHGAPFGSPGYNSPDGVLVDVYGGIPDTYFSIPAHARIRGRYVAGYLTVETASGLSTATDDDPAYWTFRPVWRRCASRYPGAVTLRGRAIRCDGRVNPETGDCNGRGGWLPNSHGNGFAARYW